VTAAVPEILDRLEAHHGPRTVGIQPRQLLEADTATLAAAPKPGGMVPGIRAMRLVEIAARIEREFPIRRHRPASRRSVQLPARAGPHPPRPGA